jgi:hypothetical protein
MKRILIVVSAVLIVWVASPLLGEGMANQTLGWESVILFGFLLLTLSSRAWLS